MDDHVDLGQGGPVGVVEAEPVDRDVTAEGADPAGDRGVEAVAPLPPEAVEGVVAEDVAPDPLGRPGPPARPHQGQHLASGHATEESFDQGRPQEPGGTGDGDTAAG